MTGLDSLRALLAEATPGPWTTKFSVEIPDVAPAGWQLGSDAVETLADFGDADSAKRDADIVVALRNAAAPLLDVAEATRAELCTCGWDSNANARLNPAERHSYECPTQRMPRLLAALAALDAALADTGLAPKETDA